MNLIENMLPIGKENAISTKDLVQMSGLRDARTLQLQIAEERKNGAIILSTNSNGGGYYLPGSNQEIAEFVRTLESRAKNTFVAIKSAKKALNVTDGQTEFDDLFNME